jgi:hypothetical protein
MKGRSDRHIVAEESIIQLQMVRLAVGLKITGIDIKRVAGHLDNIVYPDK